MRSRGGVAYGSDSIRQPAAPAITQPPAESARRATVQRIYHHPDRRSQPRPTHQPSSVGQMSMDHVRGLAPEPVVEANPSARIGQAFAHLEAQDPGSRCCQLGRGIASIA